VKPTAALLKPRQILLDVIMVSPVLHQLYFYAKVFSEIGTAVTVMYGAICWLRAMYRQSQKTNANVELLMTNHFPHMQTSLDAHGVALSNLSSDVRNVGTKVDGMEQRVEDTKKSVHALGQSFVTHLENASKESVSVPVRKRRKA
jgi:hypothetical protein